MSFDKAVLVNVTNPHAPKPGILVFGMHRSGTSLLTRLLEAAGFFVGEQDEMLPAKSCNEEGFWERKDVVALNEWLLEVTDQRVPPWPPWSGWLQGRTVTPGDLTEAQAITFRARAERILEKLKGKGRVWAMKDPRLCLTFPCWDNVLGPTVAVILHRNPLEIAASLQKREAFQTAFSLALWEYHLRSSLNATLHCPRILLSLDELHSNPRQVMGILLGFLKSQGSPAGKAADELAFHTLINPHLLHHKNTKEDSFRTCTTDQQELLRFLEQNTLPAQMEAIPQSCLQTLSEFHAGLDSRTRLQAELDHLTAKVRHVAETVSFQEELIRRLQVLAGSYRENLNQDLGISYSSSIKRTLHRLAGALPERRERLEQNLSELEGREMALHKSCAPASPSNPNIAVVLCIQDRCWLPSALKYYALAGCGTLIVTSSAPGMEGAVQEEILKAPLPPNVTFHYCECPAFQSPALPPSVLDRLAPLRPDWILAPRANEFLSPPSGYESLTDWLRELDLLGLQRIGFQEYVFQPCRESPKHLPEHFTDTIRWYYPLGAVPRRDLAWRCIDSTLLPDAGEIPEGLRREQAPNQSGILKTYLFLNHLQAQALQERDPGTLPPSLPSVADLYFDDGHPEHLNPYPPRDTHLPLFEESGGRE